MNRNLIALSLCALTAACAPAGYYDSTGVYHVDGKTVSPYRHVQNDVIVVRPVPVTPVKPVYSQAGYYDRNGIFIAPLDSGPHVARDYLPGRGQCRVWFIDRAPDDQPAIDSCSEIYGYVPQNAYVIYGG